MIRKFLGRGFSGRLFRPAPSKVIPLKGHRIPRERISRRVGLVHVMCGAETVEVATFRGSADSGTDERQTTDEHGRILRDNVFGSLEDDARRRDFTVNAMFYDPAREEVLDYHRGVPDLNARRLRMIREAG